MAMRNKKPCPMCGVQIKEESNLCRSCASKGRKKTPETIAKLSAAHCGKKHTPEHIGKIAAANRGRKRSKESIAKANASMVGHRHGKENGNWKGGRRKTSHGYITILCPRHPHADNEGYVREHRLVMESHIGRTLLPSEVVHHINGAITDNRVENLMLFSCVGKHVGHHFLLKGQEKNAPSK
jgi:NMD protein affecting ribosome stability and mRNA decay